jgi:hypothetical protein
VMDRFVLRHGFRMAVGRDGGIARGVTGPAPARRYTPAHYARALLRGRP